MNTLTRISIPSRHRSGFSLFEVLMFIAVLGVILGIVVPMLSADTDAIYAARDRRNAQELCSTCVMAQAAELDFVQEDSVLDRIAPSFAVASRCVEP